jgi:hypothetical protein
VGMARGGDGAGWGWRGVGMARGGDGAGWGWRGGGGPGEGGRGGCKWRHGGGEGGRTEEGEGRLELGVGGRSECTRARERAHSLEAPPLPNRPPVSCSWACSIYNCGVRPPPTPMCLSPRPLARPSASPAPTLTRPPHGARLLHGVQRRAVAAHAAADDDLRWAGGRRMVSRSPWGTGGSHQLAARPEWSPPDRIRSHGPSQRPPQWRPSVGAAGRQRRP